MHVTDDFELYTRFSVILLCFLQSILYFRKLKNQINIKKKESILICFKNCQGIPYSHRQSRKNRMMNTFIIVKTTSICKINLCLPTPKRPSFSLHLSTHLKEELADLLWKLSWYSLLPHRQNIQRMVNINPISKR